MVDGSTQLRSTDRTAPASDGGVPGSRRGRTVDALPGVARAVAAAALAGLVAGLWTPHWPVLAPQALGTMALGLSAGVIAGAAVRSRWVMLLAPVTFVVVYEVVRLDATGPTVDAINTVNAIALLASLAMRIAYGVIAVLPMLVGIAYGRAWKMRRAGRAPSTRGGRIGLAMASLGLLALAVAIARPAATAQITAPDGSPVPGSVAEITAVEIGGHDQRLLVRGHDVTNPVLLFLAGGPGGSELGTMARHGGLLERDFVVVTWDQRGTGASYAAFEPAATLTLDRAVADTIELTEHLRDRFDADQIYLVGNSYGTLLGVLAAQQRPDLYAAFVGTGQMVDVLETDRMFYEDTLAHARRVGDDATVDTLRTLGPPPYDDPLAMIPVTAGEQVWNDYTGVEGHQGKREFTEHLGAAEYSVLDKVSTVAGLADTYAVLYPRLQDLDLRTDVPRLDVPVFLVEGRYEARGRIEPVRDWFDRLEAPTKRLITFDLSGHRPFVEEPERFSEVMTGTVVAEVLSGGAGPQRVSWNQAPRVSR